MYMAKSTAAVLAPAAQISQEPSASYASRPQGSSSSAPTPRSTPPLDIPSSAMRRFAGRPLRRSSSRLRRWVQDQQKRYSGGDIPDSALNSLQESDATVNTAGLRASFTTRREPEPLPGDHEPDGDGDDHVSVATESFVLVDEDADQFPAEHVVDLSVSPTAPRKTRFSTSSPLRNFARGLSHTRRVSSPASNAARDSSPTRSSVFQRSTRHSSHSRGSSIATTIFAPRPSREAPSDVTSLSSTPSSSSWIFKRGRVVGHILTTSEGGNNEDSSRPPRPSTSSSITRSSETAYTRTSLDSTSTSYQRPALASIRSASPQSMFCGPSPSLWSLPTDASHFDDPPDSEKTIAREREPSGPLRIPLTFRAPSGSSGSSIIPTQRRKRKRKLVISGIPQGDHRRYDHIRIWCESFGELNQITRVPNGDLHVDFRSAEVADTVCRLHARVHINGVGSVGLSWFTGKRP